MFTGLVQAVGVVRSAAPVPAGVRLLVDPGAWSHRPALGDSIAVSGCCLTVAAIEGPCWGFDVIPETLAKTKLGEFRAGSRVNLEHAVTPQTLMGGHFVQGHVDGVGRVEGVQQGGDWRVRIGVPGELGVYLTPKGSVAVDGVSLTIAEVGAGGGGGAAGGLSFEIALIPTTLELTTLSGLREGEPVNLEADMIAKTVVSFLRNSQLGAIPPQKARS